MTSRFVARARAAVRLRVRNLFGRRVVVREVAGARLAMPWSHRLPDYVRAFPSYGRNLVDLAAELHDGNPLTVLDIGANIGDSALQIRARVDAMVLCVDGDPHWLPFLKRNTRDDHRIVIEPALVVPDPSAGPISPVRDGAGTTRFVAADTQNGVAQITADELRARHPEFDRLRLIKSDTDGYDTRIVPLLARAWADSAPVLFFEYDPSLSAKAGDRAPERVWDELAGLGYTSAAVWTNVGSPLGNGTIEDVRSAATVFSGPADARGYAYWDVAVAARNDTAGQAALARLAPGALRT